MVAAATAEGAASPRYQETGSPLHAAPPQKTAIESRLRRKLRQAAAEATAAAAAVESK